jgi:hypothetical protein
MSARPNARVRAAGGMTLRCGVAALLLAVGARDAGAQDRRLAGRVEAELAASVTRIADSVRALGLPSDPLVGVALEGASRRATNDRILAAVREYAAALGAARSALGDSAASDEIVSGAGVIVAGVAPRFMVDYRVARPRASLTVPLVVLADLVARGVPPDTAASALGAALRRGVRDDELSDFRRRVERDILAGANPSTAMTIRTRDFPSIPAGGIGPIRPKSPRLRRPGPR